MRVAALASVALLTLATCARKIWATDFWWQVATGRYVLEHGFPRGDVFSYTAQGAEWIELRWIFFVAEALLLDNLGAWSLVVLKCAMVLATFAIIAWPFRKRVDATVIATVVAVAVLAASQRFFVRPELTSWLLLAIYAVVVHRFRQSGGKALWWLLALQLIWVNAHPLFFFGPAILACGALASLFDARERVKPLALAAVAATALSLINPYGFAGLLFPVTLFLEIRDSLFSEFITELASPFAIEQSRVAFVFYRLLIALAVVTTALNWRKLDPYWLLLTIPQLYLSFLSVRNLPLFAIAAVPLILHNVARFELPKLARRPLATVVIVGSLFGVQQLLTDRWYVRQGDSNAFGFGLAEHRYPLALESMDGLRPAPDVFGSMRASAYMLSLGHRVFVDPRTEVYGEEIYRAWIEALSSSDRLRETLAAHDISLIVLDAGDPALRTVARLSEWRPVHIDAAVVLLMKLPVVSSYSGESSTTERRLERALEALGEPRAWSDRRPWQRVDSPSPYLRLADTAFALGEWDQAARALDMAERAAPWFDLSDNRTALASARAARDAEEEARRNVTEAMLQAERLRAAGELQTAAQAFGEVVQRFPDRWEPRAALARIAAQLGQRAAAIQGMELALQIAPKEPSMLVDLARWNLETGELEAAGRALARLRAAAPDHPELEALTEALQRASATRP